MTRLRLNWVTQLSMLAFAVGCGSSNSSGVSNSILSNVGGQDATTVGGTGNQGGKNSTAGTATNGGLGNNGGANSTAGSGSSNTAGNGSGTAGSNSQAGNSSGTGSTGSTTNGGSGSGLGGDAYGGDGTIVGGSGFGTGGVGSVDVKLTGGTGSSVDVSTGGSGSSVDVATGGGWSIDTGSGGGTSIDIATGGGGSVDKATGGGSSIDKATGGGSSIDKATGGGGSVDMGTGGGTSIDHGCFVTTLTNINVYVIKDATPSGADTEGSLFVGGNLTASGYSVGLKNTLDCTKNALVVGGNVALSGGTVHSGAAYFGGTNNSSASTFECGLKRGTGGVNFPALEAEVVDLSIKMSQLTPNCKISTDASGALVLTGTDPVLNVCNIAGPALGNTNVNFPAGSSVVVNVTGTNITWHGAVCLNGQCADSDQANYVVWNMYQATSIVPSGIAIQGSVLAPLATLAGGTDGHIAGQVIVKYLTSGFEYHPYYFKGCIKWPTSL